MTASEKQKDMLSRKYYKALVELTLGVHRFLWQLDTLMNAVESRERGQRIAKLANELEMLNDSIRHFTLGQRLDKAMQP